MTVELSRYLNVKTRGFFFFFKFLCTFLNQITSEEEEEEHLGYE